MGPLPLPLDDHAAVPPRGRGSNSILRGLTALVAVAFLATADPGTADAAALSVRFVSLPATHPGANETATVATKAGASCTIVVRYKSGPSTARGLTKKTANGTGRVSWTWKVGTNTARGSWPVTVTCRKGSATGSATRNLIVR